MGSEKNKTERIVIKIGSSLLTNEGRGLDAEAIKDWANQIISLRLRGYEVILVSSGAVAEGKKRLGWTSKPRVLHQLQAAASVGQVGLVEAYAESFHEQGVTISQILLTHDDFSDRTRYLNARSTINALLGWGIVPIVNENDTVATAEIQFGDNDTLAALVTNLLEAHLLIILTDQDGLFDLDPRKNKHAKLVTDGQAGDAELEKMASEIPGSHIGSGGMQTKVLAAKRAAASGADTIIASGHENNILLRLVDGEKIGTKLKATKVPLDAKRQWLANNLKIKGTVSLDTGAETAIVNDGKSLLPVGVEKVEGSFIRGDLVSCVGPTNNEIARGLVNYNSDEAIKLIGITSGKIEEALGYIAEEELIHRNNLVIL